MKARPARPFFLFASNLEAISMHATIEQVENISQINKVADLDTAWYNTSLLLNFCSHQRKVWETQGKN